MEDDKDYYKTLGVARDAKAEAIRKAYKQLAFKFHPDKNRNDPLAEDKFKEITEAYEVLSDESKRGIYDKYGAAGLEQRGFEPADFDPTDILRNMFGFENTISVPPVEIIHEVSLEELFTGSNNDFTFDRFSICSNCDGKGGVGKNINCKSCKGTGAKLMRMMGGVAQMPCNDCEGTGVNPNADKCKVCEGDGTKLSPHTIKLKIERGHSKTKPIIIQNEGNEIPKNERSKTDRSRSNLVIMIKEKEHKTFTRGSIIKELKKINEDNLVTELHLTLAESLCGFQKNICHLDMKEIKITMTDMVKHSDIIVMKGEGMYKHASDKRGDLLIRIRVETKKFSKSDKAKLWSLFSDEPYTHHSKNSPGIVLFDDYKKEAIEENENETMKEQYKQRKTGSGGPGRPGNRNNGGNAPVECTHQ